MISSHKSENEQSNVEILPQVSSNTYKVVPISAVDKPATVKDPAAHRHVDVVGLKSKYLHIIPSPSHEWANDAQSAILDISDHVLIATPEYFVFVFMELRGF